MLFKRTEQTNYSLIHEEEEDDGYDEDDDDDDVD
jgi:hypothetical protein